eukprot:6172838-Pleurochrysis_carterae.AAC.2
MQRTTFRLRARVLQTATCRLPALKQTLLVLGPMGAAYHLHRPRRVPPDVADVVPIQSLLYEMSREREALVAAERVLEAQVLEFADDNVGVRVPARHVVELLPRHFHTLELHLELDL